LSYPAAALLAVPGVPGRWDPGADVDDLPDPGLTGQVADGPLRECPVGWGDGADFGEGAQDLRAGCGVAVSIWDSSKPGSIASFPLVMITAACQRLLCRAAGEDGDHGRIRTAASEWTSDV